MKTLVEKLKNYNRWRRGDKTVPQPASKEVGEMIDQAIEAIEGCGGIFKACGLRVLNDEVSLQAVGWDDVRLLLSKVQLLAVLHDLKWVDVEHRGFTMMVEKDSDVDHLAQEFEAWEKGKKEKRNQRGFCDSNEDHRWELVRGGHREEGGLR